MKENFIKKALLIEKTNAKHTYKHLASIAGCTERTIINFFNKSGGSVETGAKLLEYYGLTIVKAYYLVKTNK